MGNIGPQDISKQIPAWSLLTSAYLFRDANHLTQFFASEMGAQMKKMVEDQLKVKILGPTFFGTRQGGLEAEEEDQRAGRPGGREAAHASRRQLATAGSFDRRQPDAHGLRRKPTPACRPGRSMARTTHCPTCRT